MSEEENVEESPLPEGVMADLKSKHGPVLAFEVEGFGAFAFHKPSQAVNDRVLNKAADSSEKAQAVREFALSCLCWPVTDSGKPDYKAARALFEALPDAPTDLLPELKDLAPKINIKKW